MLQHILFSQNQRRHLAVGLPCSIVKLTAGTNSSVMAPHWHPARHPITCKPSSHPQTICKRTSVTYAYDSSEHMRGYHHGVLLRLDRQCLLQFDPTFDPQLGGKLPGLYLSPPDVSNTRGGSGSRHCASCASARLMWRSGLQAEAYVYSTCAQDSCAYAAQPGCHLNPRFGDSLWRGVLQFQPDRWNEVAVRVRLNAVGRADGLLRVSVNGKVCELGEMRWRSMPETVVSSVFFCTFYGGSKDRFACPADTCIRFKDFEVRRFA